MNSEHQSQGNSGRKPYLRLSIILVLVAISLVAQYASFYHVLTRALPAHETGGFQYIHWEFGNNLAPYYKNRSDSFNELSASISSFCSGEEMQSLIEDLDDYSNLRKKLKLSERTYREEKKSLSKLNHSYSGQVQSNIDSVNSAAKSRESLIRHYTIVAKEYNDLISSKRSAIRVYGSEARYNNKVKDLKGSIDRLKDRIENPSKIDVTAGLSHIGSEVQSAAKKIDRLQSEISAQRRDESVLLRAIWEKWNSLMADHMIITKKLDELDSLHRNIQQKLYLMEIYETDIKQLHAKFLSQNGKFLEFFNEGVSEWKQLCDLVVQEDLADPRDFDERKLVDTYWLKGENALRGQMSLKANNQVEWMHDSGKRTALGVWRKNEDGKIMASFGAGYFIFNREKNGNLTLIGKSANDVNVALRLEEQEIYRPPEATPKEREQQFVLMAKAHTAGEVLLSKLNALYSSSVAIEKEFNTMTEKYNVQAIEEFGLIRGQDPEAKKFKLILGN